MKPIDMNNYIIHYILIVCILCVRQSSRAGDLITWRLATSMTRLKNFYYVKIIILQLEFLKYFFSSLIVFNRSWINACSNVFIIITRYIHIAGSMNRTFLLYLFQNPKCVRLNHKQITMCTHCYTISCMIKTSLFLQVLRIDCLYNNDVDMTASILLFTAKAEFVASLHFFPMINRYTDQAYNWIEDIFCENSPIVIGLRLKI